MAQTEWDMKWESSIWIRLDCSDGKKFMCYDVW